MKLKTFIAPLLLLIHISTGSAHADGFTLSGTEVHPFTSVILEDDIQIAVSLPFGYSQSENSYPLVLALDGDIMFGITSEIPRLMSFERAMPPVVVATILYGDFQTWIAKRQRDYHSNGGGADRLIKALQDEILPYLAENYRINMADKTLYGHSSGGVFALYTALKSPALFERILASSPSLEEEPTWQETMPTMAVEANENPPKLFVSIGGAEPKTLSATASLLTVLKNTRTTQKFKYREYEGMPHMTVIAGAYTDGMRWLFAK